MSAYPFERAIHACGIGRAGVAEDISTSSAVVLAIKQTERRLALITVRGKLAVDPWMPMRLHKLLRG
jgi:hypothetical protein